MAAACTVPGSIRSGAVLPPPGPHRDIGFGLQLRPATRTLSQPVSMLRGTTGAQLGAQEPNGATSAPAGDEGTQPAAVCRLGRQELDALLLSSGFPGACCHLHPFPDGPGTQAKLGHGGGGGRGGSSMDWSILKISFNPESSEHNLGLRQRCCPAQEPAGGKAGHSGRNDLDLHSGHGCRLSSHNGTGRTPALPGRLAAPSSVLGAHVWDRKGTRVLHARSGSHPTHTTKVQTTAGFLSGGAEGRTHCFCPKQVPSGPATHSLGPRSEALGTTAGTGLSSESPQALRALTRSGSMPPSSWSHAQRG
ncbi:Terminal Uridylyltransferase 4 [Manis pentadactyla]|nr:Terminal Uridylyltransferase 4 [Manis pentadactyla]